MDNYSYTSNLDELSSVRLDLFGNFDSSDSSTHDNSNKQTTVHSINDNYDNEDCYQSVNTETDSILQDINQTDFYLHKIGASNMSELYSQPIVSVSKETSKSHKESGYAINELSWANAQTSHCFINKISELQSNSSEEQSKRTKKVGRKLRLIRGKKSAYCERKLAHATAESRYRSSINEQIRKLKTLVAGPNANWKKSAILETVAQYIRQLKKVNSSLVEENLQLKLKLSHSSPVIPSTISTSYLVIPTISSLANNCIQIPYSTTMYSCI